MGSVRYSESTSYRIQIRLAVAMIHTLLLMTIRQCSVVRFSSLHREYNFTEIVESMHTQKTDDIRQPDDRHVFMDSQKKVACAKTLALCAKFIICGVFHAISMLF